MVEYGLILAHNATGLLTQDLVSWVSEVGWERIGYAVLALVALRLAVGAFRPSH